METGEDCEEIVNVVNEQTDRIGDAHEQTVNIERFDWNMCILCQNTNNNKMESYSTQNQALKNIRTTS